MDDEIFFYDYTHITSFRDLRLLNCWAPKKRLRGWPSRFNYAEKPQTIVRECFDTEIDLRPTCVAKRNWDFARLIVVLITEKRGRKSTLIAGRSTCRSSPTTNLGSCPLSSWAFSKDTPRSKIRLNICSDTTSARSWTSDLYPCSIWESAIKNVDKNIR